MPAQPANNQGSNTTLITQSRGAEYIVRRLKRDAANPAALNHAQAKDALAKLQAGTIVSARAAGIAVGNKILQDTPEVLDDAPLYLEAWTELVACRNSA
jgi:hypothetical protein